MAGDSKQIANSLALRFALGSRASSGIISNLLIKLSLPAREASPRRWRKLLLREYSSVVALCLVTGPPAFGHHVTWRTQHESIHRIDAVGRRLR